VQILDGYEYDEALIGVTTDGRAVYEFEKMVECLMNKYEWSDIDAIEWIDTTQSGHYLILVRKLQLLCIH
jgi:hypothetical protein